MRHRTRSAALAASLFALLAACSRDLTIPGKNQLAIEPAFASVAPRQSLTFGGVGGGGGYAFAFAAGGKLSGDDASIDPATGAYRAGASGSAQDVVVVTDASGQAAEARITVGPRVTVSPTVALLSPGQSLLPTVAGGLPPYTFTLTPAAGSTGQLDPVGQYTAGAEGDVVDLVVVSDQTGDPAATATVELHVGARIRIYPPTASVAPGESLPFVALGGQAPYGFAIFDAQSGAPTISPTGTYVAGANPSAGSRTDVVRVTDAMGQVSEALVTVGPPLSVTLPVSIVQPGVAVQLAAAGGKAPYVYGFRPHGNRSHGSVDTASGAYVPGANYGARDLLQVRDATGTIVALSPDPLVGPTRFDAGATPARGAAADLNGDGRDDAVVLRYDPTNLQTLYDLTVYSRPAGKPATSTTYYLPPGHGGNQLFVADLDGDAHDELRFFGGGKAMPLVPDLAGNLALGTTVNVPFSPPFSAAPIAGGLRFYTTQLCTAGVANGLCVYDWPVGQPSPPVTACTCVAVPRTTGRAVRAIAAGDVDGDGVTDLAWTEDIDAAGSAKALAVAYGSGAPAAFPASPSAWMTLPTAPAGYWRFEVPFYDPEGGIQVFPGGAGAVISLSGSGQRAAYAWHAGQASGEVFNPFGAGTGGSGGMGFRPTGSGFVAYGFYRSPFIAGYAWDAATSLYLPMASVVSPSAPLADGLYGIALPDLEGDGAVDLVAPSAASGAAWIYPGDGDGGFGMRARFQGTATPGAVALGDIDGDPFTDAVVGTDLPGLAILWGGDHQLAFGGETRVTLAAAAMAVGDYQGTGGLSALVIDQGGNTAIYPLATDGTVGAKTPVTATALVGLLPPRISPSRTLGDAGLGYWGVSGGSNPTVNYYYAQVWRRTGPTSFGWTEAYPGVSAPLSSTYRCATAPVSKADAGDVPRIREMVELCTSDYQRIDLWQAAVSKRNPFTFASCAYNDPVCSWGAGPVSSQSGTGTALKAGVAYAGQLPDGSAVFVGSTGAATAPVDGWALTVKAAAVDGDPLVLLWLSLGTLPGPVDGATLGLLSTTDTFPDLAVTAGGKVHVFLDSAGTLSTGTGALAAVAGVGAVGRIVGAAPFASGVAWDPLMLAGEDLIPLQNTGLGVLR